MTLVLEAFAEFSIGAPYVLAEGMAPGGLILLQRVMWLGSLNGCLAFIGRRLRTRDQNGDKQQDED